MTINYKTSDYKYRIENSRVYDVAKNTPLEFQPNLSARIGNRVLLKREDMQPVLRLNCAVRITKWRIYLPMCWRVA